MEGATIQFSQSQYPRSVSPVSIPAYQPPYKYLSPPSSWTQSPTTDANFASSPAGLGITHYHIERRSDQQGLRNIDTVQEGSPFKSEHNFSVNQAAILPSQYTSQPPYSRGAPYPSTHWVPRTQYGLHIPSSTDAVFGTSHVRYQSDVAQDDKWVLAGSEQFFPTPETRTDNLSWMYSGAQHYPSPNQYAVSHQILCLEVYEQVLTKI